MFAEPRFVVATAVEPLDQLEIALQGQRRIDAGFVERREKNAEVQVLAHGTVLFVSLRRRAFKPPWPEPASTLDSTSRRRPTFPGVWSLR
jgi:hypothetical protein